MTSRVASLVHAAVRRAGRRTAVLGVSGIDEVGIGQITARVARTLHWRRCRPTNVDSADWMDPRSKWFDAEAAPYQFYRYGIRLEEMFTRLVIPLRDDRTRLESGDTDVILVKGAFLFKRQYRDLFDLRIWVDCTFDTALERAANRDRGVVSPADAPCDYETIHLPALQLHIDIDDPGGSAHAIVTHDHRLVGNDPPSTSAA